MHVARVCRKVIRALGDEGTRSSELLSGHGRWRPARDAGRIRSGGLIAQTTNLGVPYLLRALVLVVTFGLAYPYVTEEIASKQHLFGNARLREHARQKRDPPGVKRRRHPSRPHEQKAQHEQDKRDAAGNNNALRTRPSKAKSANGRPESRAQQNPLDCSSRDHDQRANDDALLPAIAPEHRRRAMKEAEDQEQAQYQTKPVGSPFNPG